MQNTYCKALEGALKDGCFAKVFLSGARYPVARIEKAFPGKKEYDLIAYYEGGHIISTLFGAAEKLMAEGAEISEDDRLFSCPGIEREVGSRGYTLHVTGLPNGKILSMVCSGCHPNYIPLKTVIGDNVQEALELLDVTLMKFDFDSCEFIRFAEEQAEPIQEYHRKKWEENQKKDN